MRFGLLFRPQDPPRAEHLGRRWQEVLHAAEVAEEFGFDGVFLPEHHMREDGYPPSPWAALGALAARTQRVDVGTAVHLLPLRHPFDVAESAAMVDVISNGRLRLGVGLGNFAPEYELYGWDKREQVSRFEEAIDIVGRAWSGEEMDHHGRHFTVKGRLRPLPVGAQLWLGATTPPGVRRAARLRRTWLASPLPSLSILADLAKLYRSELPEDADGELVLLRDGFVADSVAEAKRIWWSSLRREHWSSLTDLPRFTGERDAPAFRALRSPEDIDFDQHRRDRLIVGSPEDCIEQIQRFQEALRVDYLVMTFRVAHGPSAEHELESIRRFGSEVIPAFR
jgi:alkanesulfonate monooxygenase SsuD/methylene tetrahydromethanopterin reductase-like flavin-dependent oxidoreductase (luciferase family)